MEIDDFEKTKQYINYLIKDLKIFSLIAPVDRNSAKKVNEMIKKDSMKKIESEEKPSKKTKTEEQSHFEDLDSNISFGQVSEDD